MSLLSKLRNRLRWKSSNWFHAFAQGSKIHYLQESLRQAQISNDHLMSLWLQGQPAHPNPLTRFGKKYFSQADEDGILLEILRRIGLNSGTCVEIGCGDGLENNTLILLSQGWKTVWIDAAPLAFDPMCNTDLLVHYQEFVAASNVPRLVRQGIHVLHETEIDVLSIDIDGNDGYIAEALLRDAFKPSLIVIETNEILPPPIVFRQAYDPSYVWDHTKNSGWSLQAISNLLEGFGYSCLACNLQTGVNAFFVRQDLRGFFPDVPTNLEALYVGPSSHPFKYRDRRTKVTAELVEQLVRNAHPANKDLTSRYQAGD